MATKSNKEREELLATARIIEPIHPRIHQGTRSAKAIEIYQLEGIKAFFKRGDVDPPGVQGIRREVAAYRIADAIGWGDLVPVTALRRVPNADGVEIEVAAAELIVDAIEDAPITSFADADIARAGVFDAIINHGDRGHNWFAIPRPDGTLGLKLFDHEIAFEQGDVVSAFWEHLERQLPVDLRPVISDLAARLDDPPGSDLLSAAEIEVLRDRIAFLRSGY